MRKGIATIIATIILVVITIGLVSTAYLYFAGLISGSTSGTVQLIDAYCDKTNDDIIIIVQNKGTDTINGLTFVLNGATLTQDSSNFEDDSCDDTISVGGSATCKINSTSVIDGMNEIRVIGPANPVGGSVNCA